VGFLQKSVPSLSEGHLPVDTQIPMEKNAINEDETLVPLGQ
jgi:hypothetical protein